ncbi:MAG TPA: class I SAM-dependent methyltransferase [Candidatus Dormibacteraeota bacterium]|nr:class I SAM-dependent methyltransferase [Candidatus Dormibacteraeota bacterium]
MKQEHRAATTEAYNKSALPLANYYNTKSRVADVKLALSYTKKADPQVVEIGCGNGRDAREVLKYTENYLGMDIAEEMINLARASHPQAKFEVADITEYDIPACDVVLAFASLLHVSPAELEDIFRRLSQAISPGGIVLLSLKEGKGSQWKEDEYGKRLFYLYTPESIKPLAKGFKTVYTDHQLLNGVKWFTQILRKK